MLRGFVETKSGKYLGSTGRGCVCVDVGEALVNGRDAVSILRVLSFVQEPCAFGICRQYPVDETFLAARRLL